MPFMWADSLLAAEQAHVLRLLVWGAVSVLVGTGLIAWLQAGARRSPLLDQFGMQIVCWGILDLVLAISERTRLVPRDLAGATRLDRLLWLNIGLDIGYTLIGATLVITGWRLGRRQGLIGAGCGVAVQGAALAVFHLVLASQISR